jgi:ribonuclease HII
MSYLIGTDEAGYGPNLGPLVIVATVWQVDDPVQNAASADLYERLAAVVSRTPDRGANGRAPRVAIADSKRLYTPAQGLGLLERGVLAALGVAGRAPADWRDAWDDVCPGALADCHGPPSHRDFDLSVPLETDGDDLAQLIARLRDGLAQAGVRLAAIRGRAVFPPQFNDLIERHGSKGEALSRLTIGLVAEVLETLDAPAAIVCDKHGGRSRYASLLQRQFPDDLVHVLAEGRGESAYRCGPPEAATLIRFRARAESDLAAALASMTAKYLRELAMRALNDYWCKQVPGLRSTAGYPQDARRFKREIAARQQSLGIDDRVIWRTR